MKTTTAFRTLNAMRIARQNTGGYNVRALTKSGQPSKVLSSDYNGQTEFSLEQATAYKTRLEELNADRTWLVLPT
jgi:hypothetical protein